MSLIFEGVVAIDGPEGASATLLGEGSDLTLQVTDLKSARKLLGSQALRAHALQIAPHLNLLGQIGCNFRICVGNRTLFSTDAGGKAAAALADFLHRFR